MSRMFNLFSAGIIAVGLSVASASAASASSVRVTVDDQMWDVTTLFGSFTDLEATLTQQVWWANASLAEAFAVAVTDSLTVEPYFAYEVTPQPSDATDFRARSFFYNSSVSEAWTASPPVGIAQNYATASAVAPIPLPAGGLLLLSALAAAAGLRYRRNVAP